MGGLGWEFGLRMRALLPPGESARLLARRAQHPKLHQPTPPPEGWLTGSPAALAALFIRAQISHALPTLQLRPLV